jgi:hypothetical protein
VYILCVHIIYVYMCALFDAWECACYSVTCVCLCVYICVYIVCIYYICVYVCAV